MSGFKGYRPLSAEGLVAAAPDVILGTREGVEELGGVDAMLSASRASALTLRGQGEARAGTRTPCLLLGFGPRLPQAVRSWRRSSARRA